MSVLRRFGTTLSTVAVLGCAAMLLPALILPAGGPPQSVLVLFGSVPDVATLPNSLTLLAWDGHWARFDNVGAATARRLYGHGALMIVPIRKSGCMGLSQI